VMVVDDVQDNRALVKACFAGTAVNVVEAIHGQDAIEQLHAAQVDLVLMDLRMPVMNGYEAVEIIRRDEACRDLPIVALTASVLGNDLQKIENFGFNGYIQKPVEKKRLLQEVARFIPCRSVVAGADSLPERVWIDSAVTREAILARMENDLLEEWKNVRDKGDVQLIQKFSDNLAKLATEHGFAYLRRYAEKLSLSVDSFDLSEIYDLMLQYPDLIQIIKNAEVEANV
jgi:two-component system sensor histidine kinase EvgS